MCRECDLVVLVVDSDESALEQTCASLTVIGIDREKIICVHSYEQAIDAISTNTDIDIVVADFNIEDGKDLGPLLCSAMKKIEPGLFFILTSKEGYSCSVALEGLKHSAEDILDLRRKGEIESMMKKWVYLARHKNMTRDLVYGNKRP